MKNLKPIRPIWLSVPDESFHESHNYLDLALEVAVTVNTFGWAILRHDREIVHVVPGYVLWVLPILQKDPSFLVDSGILIPELEPTIGRPLKPTTRVFNTTAQPLYIKKGTVLSRLVALKLE